MFAAVWGMIVVGTVTLVAGLVLVRARFRAASGAGKLVVLGPVFEAVALAVFATEHFFIARDLMGIVPRWLPGPLFWTYFVGVAWVAAAVSFVTWRGVRWSAPLVALLFLIIVATVSLPGLQRHVHERLFWTLTVRETGFASGAIVLAGSLWPAHRGKIFVRLGRFILGPIFIFYAIEHFLFPAYVPGVPLEKLTPAWMPAPTLIAYAVGITLFFAGFGFLIRRTARFAAAGSGTVLVLLTLFFYVPILTTEIHGPLALEGINYVADTLLFASTALLSGFGEGLWQAEDSRAISQEIERAGSLATGGH